MNAYMQSTIGMGFIAICQDMVNLLRTALVNTTLPSPGTDVSYPIKSISETSTPSLVTAGTVTGIVTFHVVAVDSKEEDKPRERYWYRRLSDVLYVGFLGAQVPGVVGNSDYNNAVEKPSEKLLVSRLRCGLLHGFSPYN
jgi:hypothetical protein